MNLLTQGSLDALTRQQSSATSDRNSIVFAVLSFEGPDPYAHAGGLGTRVSGLTRALAEAGFETHLFFVGAPDLPGHEVLVEGKLHLHRWCQWISQYYLGGVYDGEEGKLEDWQRSLPQWLEEQFIPPLVEAGQHVVVMAEEWQTSETVLRIAEAVERHRWDGWVHLLWNANNTFSFDRVPWDRLGKVATLTTVSRFMKHQLWGWDADARVVPNGIPSSWLSVPDRRSVECLKRMLRGRLSLAKIARWDPDKRWLMAVDAAAELKRRNLQPLLLARGGMEGHGQEVLQRARMQGLQVAHARMVDATERSLAWAVASGIEAGADILIFEDGLTQRQLQVLYRAVDAVLANSGIEPFGLVGLEAMASGGLVFVGATGEDYVTAGHDGVSLQTNQPGEIVGHLVCMQNHPEAARGMRRAARITAARYIWPEVLRRNITPLLLDLGLPVSVERVPARGRRPQEELPPDDEPADQGLMGPFGNAPLTRLQDLIGTSRKSA